MSWHSSKYKVFHRDMIKKDTAEQYLDYDCCLADDWYWYDDDLHWDDDRYLDDYYQYLEDSEEYNLNSRILLSFEFEIFEENPQFDVIESPFAVLKSSQKRHFLQK